MTTNSTTSSTKWTAVALNRSGELSSVTFASHDMDSSFWSFWNEHRVKNALDLAIVSEPAPGNPVSCIDIWIQDDDEALELWTRAAMATMRGRPCPRPLAATSVKTENEGQRAIKCTLWLADPVEEGSQWASDLKESLLTDLRSLSSEPELHPPSDELQSLLARLHPQRQPSVMKVVGRQRSSSTIESTTGRPMQRQRSTSTTAFSLRAPSTIAGSFATLDDGGMQPRQESNVTWSSSVTGSNMTASTTTTSHQRSPTWSPQSRGLDLLSGPHQSISASFDPSGTFEPLTQPLIVTEPPEDNGTPIPSGGGEEGVALFKKMRSLRKKIRFAHQHLARAESVRSAAEKEKIDKLPLFQEQLRECEDQAKMLGLLELDDGGSVPTRTPSPVKERKEKSVVAIAAPSSDPDRDHVKQKMIRSIARHNERMKVIEGTADMGSISEAPELNDADRRRKKELMKLDRQRHIALATPPPSDLHAQHNPPDNGCTSSRLLSVECGPLSQRAPPPFPSLVSSLSTPE